MTQRIFDIENEKDMHDLWEILSDGVYKITQGAYSDVNTYWVGERYSFDSTLIKINWHDKTEITRPVNYEDMIGCVGWVGNSRDARDRIGILNSYYKGSGYPFETTDGDEFAFFTPAKKSELKFYGD